MKEIAKEILIWHQDINRDLPWKETDNPYFIWLSEIILQQTRVEQGRNYYLKFISNFPTIQDLARAPEDKVLNLWQGLGYYSRARNLHASAKYIVNELNGVFPNSYIEILRLKGVGPYTAAAIASFAFNEPVAVLDGNVFRVLSRLFDIDTDILSSKGKKEFTIVANELLGNLPAAEFNQAIMDFGALRCSPKPKCNKCPIQDLCVSYQQKTTHIRPVKKKKQARKKRFFHYFVLEKKGQILVGKRAEKDIWQGLYQFPLAELSNRDSIISANFELDSTPVKSQATFHCKQILSHQEIYAYFYTTKDFKLSNYDSYQWVKIDSIKNFGFPKTIVDFLKFKNWL